MSLNTMGATYAIGLGLFLAGPGAAQTFFTEVTDEAFSTSSNQLGGITFGDYNNADRSKYPRPRRCI